MLPLPSLLKLRITIRIRDRSGSSLHSNDEKTLLLVASAARRLCFHVGDGDRRAHHVAREVVVARAEDRPVDAEVPHRRDGRPAGPVDADHEELGVDAVLLEVRRVAVVRSRLMRPSVNLVNISSSFTLPCKQGGIRKSSFFSQLIRPLGWW